MSHDRTFTKMWQRVTELLEDEYDFFLVWSVVGHQLLLPIYNAPYVTYLEFCFTRIWKSVYSPIYSKNCHEQNALLQCFEGGFHSCLSGSFILRWNNCRIYMTQCGSWWEGGEWRLWAEGARDKIFKIQTLACLRLTNFKLLNQVKWNPTHDCDFCKVHNVC